MSSEVSPLLEELDLYVSDEESAGLDPTERYVVAARANHLTHAEIAAQLGVSRGRVSHIVARPDVQRVLRAERRLRVEEMDAEIVLWWPRALNRLRTIIVEGEDREAIQAIREARMIQGRATEREDKKEQADVLKQFALFLGVNVNVFAHRVPPVVDEEQELLVTTAGAEDDDE